MELISLAATILAFGGADFVLLLSALGGLSGLAAVLTVFVNHKANTKRAKIEDKSVAITELEKAVPGMGDVIKVWQDVVHHLQEENSDLRVKLTMCENDLNDSEEE